MRSSALVRISRTIRHSDRIDGFVVAIGQTWVLLASLDDRMHLDGHVALRVGDVSKVRRRGEREDFVRRALLAREEWPPLVVDVDLDEDRELIRTAAERAPLITLHSEREDPDVCFIGRPVRFGKRSVHMETIDPNGRWEEGTAKWALADLTRIEFGGGYEEALALVGTTG